MKIFSMLIFVVSMNVSMAKEQNYFFISKVSSSSKEYKFCINENLKSCAIDHSSQDTYLRIADDQKTVEIVFPKYTNFFRAVGTLEKGRKVVLNSNYELALLDSYREGEAIAPSQINKIFEEGYWDHYNGYLEVAIIKKDKQQAMGKYTCLVDSN